MNVTAISLLMNIGDHFHDCLTIVEMTADAQVCRYVNQMFTEHTGYSEEDALGKNLNFLQGPNTSPETVDVMRKAIQESSACCVDILNYRKDGTEFPNRLVMLPMTRDAHRYYIGFQNVIDQPISTGSHSSHGEINHVLNNHLAALVMNLDIAVQQHDAVDERLSECEDVFREVNQFCRNIDEPCEFRSYNPFAQTTDH